MREGELSIQAGEEKNFEAKEEKAPFSRLLERSGREISNLYERRVPMDTKSWKKLGRVGRALICGTLLAFNMELGASRVEAAGERTMEELQEEKEPTKATYRELSKEGSGERGYCAAIEIGNKVKVMTIGEGNIDETLAKFDPQKATRSAEIFAQSDALKVAQSCVTDAYGLWVKTVIESANPVGTMENKTKVVLKYSVERPPLAEEKVIKRFSKEGPGEPGYCEAMIIGGKEVILVATGADENGWKDGAIEAAKAVGRKHILENFGVPKPSLGRGEVHRTEEGDKTKTTVTFEGSPFAFGESEILPVQQVPNSKMVTATARFVFNLP